MLQKNKIHKIGIKLCGHCSPRKDMQSLVYELSNIMEDCRIVYWMQDTNVDVLLILNACEAGCASCPAFAGKVIRVTPETVDCYPVKEEELADAIRERLETLWKNNF